MLHGGWRPGAGLSLWRDDDPAGTERTLGPAEAARLLTEPVDDATIAEDLRRLRHAAEGLRRHARAGRVVPHLVRADGAWWARWRLLGGTGTRAWRAELLAAMPGGIVAFDDFVAELTDPITRLALPDVPVSHPLTVSLVTGAPLAQGDARIAELLTRWRETDAADARSLVLRLLEPDDPDELWRLQVCLRRDGEPPEPSRAALDHVDRAVRAYPRLGEVPRDGADLLLPTAVVIDLVEHGSAALAEAGVGVLVPRAWRAAAPSLRLTVTDPAAGEGAIGLDRLVSYRWRLAVGEVELTGAEMRRLVDASADLVRLRDEWVHVDTRVLAAAARYLTGRPDRGQAPLGELLRAVREAPVPDAPIEATGLDAAPAPVDPPRALRARLRPYQRRGLDWLAAMSERGLGGVLADDMGLGKTVQLLALLAHEHGRASHPTLLVCPMSVVGNWQREAQRFVPSLRVLVHHGPDRARGATLRDAVAAADLVVTTYGLVAKDVAALAELPWERVVLDEAQHVKNAGTVGARAVRAIRARHRLALTGTPIENRLEELRSILDFVNPGLLGSRQSFRARFAVPIERDGDAAAASRLRAVTAPFVLRRVKTDPAVIADLPAKLELTVRANLTAEQAALYQAVLDEMLRRIDDSVGMARKGAVLATLTRLKQVCNHPAQFLGDGSPVTRRGRHRSGKLALVEDVLDTVLGEGERALLFTQFREFGELIAPYLADRFGIEVPFLHGGVARGARERMVARFGDADGPPVMLVSLRAGGTGLNLTAASHVLHLDRWWNPAVENQATDRAFRIGQTRTVQVRKLVCVGTVEERVDALLAEKQDLAELVVGMGAARLRELFALGEEAVGE